MKEYWFNELGYFTKETVENIKKNLDGATYMKFKVIYNNCCGNYRLGICTDSEESEQEIKNFFLACALTYFSLLAR